MTRLDFDGKHLRDEGVACCACYEPPGEHGCGGLVHNELKTEETFQAETGLTTFDWRSINQCSSCGKIDISAPEE